MHRLFRVELAALARGCRRRNLGLTGARVRPVALWRLTRSHRERAFGSRVARWRVFDEHWPLSRQRPVARHGSFPVTRRASHRGAPSHSRQDRDQKDAPRPSTEANHGSHGEPSLRMRTGLQRENVGRPSSPRPTYGRADRVARESVAAAPRRRDSCLRLQAASGTPLRPNGHRLGEHEPSSAA
jgi:hypothetical protein